MKSWPKIIKGGSTGLPPVQVRRMKIVENERRVKYWKFSFELVWVVGERGRAYRMRMAANMIVTPPSLLGIERRTA